MLLSDVGLWHDEWRKEGRTVVYDKREIMPKFVVTVSTLQYPHYTNSYLSVYSPGGQVQIPKSRWEVP